jgi:hypothetical protein
MVDESDYRDEADDLDESDDWDESDGPKDGVEKGVAEKLCQINARLDKIAVQSRKVEERARFTGGLLIVMAIGFIWVWSATFGGRIASYPATKQADGSFFYLVVSAINNETYASAVRSRVHEKSSGHPVE